ncbi:hypothetical protein EJ04DRAFT_482822, partial [Polyplosphaeria fusca]
MEDNSIAKHVQLCFAGFNEACVSLTGAEERIKRKAMGHSLVDELGRFRLWCANAAAHRKGKSSLDWKLREASHIKDRVANLLENLQTVTREANEIITGDRTPWEDMSDDESDIDLPGLSSDEIDSTELQQLIDNMAEIITCLMRLSMAIRNPAAHDQFKASSHIDVSHYENFDVDHVRGKFPDAPEYLTIRLGKAISRRRQYLRYRNEHRLKLEKDIEPVSAAPVVRSLGMVPPTIVSSTKVESTVASSIPTAMKAGTVEATFDENDYYDDVLSQTSYSSSVNDTSKLRPPPLPDAGQGGNPFECPLCYRFASVRQVSAWHKHVYRDLQPYNDMEVNDDCVLCLQTLPSLVQLRRHMGKHHEELALFALPSHMKDDQDVVESEIGDHDDSFAD